MEIAISVLIFLHVVGAALVFGIWVANFKKAIVVPGQFHAAMLQVLTGFALFFIYMSQGMDMNHMKMGIKIVIALIIAVAAFAGQKKYKTARATGDLSLARNIPLAHTVGGLALVNIALATILP